MNASETAQCQYPTPSFLQLSELSFPDLPFLSPPPLLPSLPSPPPPSIDLKETKNKKPDQDRLEEPEILAASFSKKPV